MSDITISYKGSSIATMDATGTKTLLTEGKYCEDDIEVAYVKPSGGGNMATGTYTPVSKAKTFKVDVPFAPKHAICYASQAVVGLTAGWEQYGAILYSDSEATAFTIYTRTANGSYLYAGTPKPSSDFTYENGQFTFIGQYDFVVGATYTWFCWG